MNNNSVSIGLEQITNVATLTRLFNILEEGYQYYLATALVYENWQILKDNPNLILKALERNVKINLVIKYGITFDPLNPFPDNDFEQIESIMKFAEPLRSNNLQVIIGPHRLNPTKTLIDDYYKNVISILLKFYSKIDGIVLSEISLRQLQKFHSILKQGKCNKPLYIEQSFGLLNQRIIPLGIKNFCYINRIKIFGYNSLAKGMLTDKLTYSLPNREAIIEVLGHKGNVFIEGVGTFDEKYIMENYEICKNLSLYSKDLMMTIQELSLRWSISQDVLPIVSSSNIKRIIENLSTFKLGKLTKNCISQIEKLAPSSRHYGDGNNPLMSGHFDDIEGFGNYYF